jgi:hypothetical protein
MRAALHLLARDFDRIAVPEQGKYVETAETSESEPEYVTGRYI